MQAVPRVTSFLPPKPEPESDSIEYWLARHRTGLKLVPLKLLATALGMNPEPILGTPDPEAYQYLQNKAETIIPMRLFFATRRNGNWRNECTGFFVTDFGLQGLFALPNTGAYIRTQAIGYFLQDRSPKELRTLQGSVVEGLSARYR